MNPEVCCWMVGGASVKLTFESMVWYGFELVVSSSLQLLFNTKPFQIQTHSNVYICHVLSSQQARQAGIQGVKIKID